MDTTTYRTAETNVGMIGYVSTEEINSCATFPLFFFFFFEPRNYSNHSKLLQLPCIWCILLKAFHALIENSEQCHSFFESSMYVCFTYVLIYKVVCHLLTMVYRHTIINGEHRHWPGPS